MADPQLLTARRGAFALLALALALAGGAPRAASAWGNAMAHEALADGALMRANSGEQLDVYLEELGFEDGMESQLALFLDFDGLEDVEAEFSSGRFDRILLNVVSGGPAPTNAFLYRAFAAEVVPFEFSIPHLIRAGTFAEDNPNPRARHHFHDPVHLHEPPSGNRGLDDRDRLPTRIDELLAEVGAFVRGGDWDRFSRVLGAYFDGLNDVGNFNLRGRSARDRALNQALGAPSPSLEAPRNHFALPDAERYLFRGVTGGTPEEREGAVALHFLAFGHALHLLQDQTSPGHVRNDFDIEHVVAHSSALRRSFGFPTAGTDLETAADSETAVRLIQSLAASTDLLASRPRRWLEAVGGPAANYAIGQEPLDPTGLELSAFWDGASGSAPPGRRGLSERTNASFLSAGSISNSAPFGYPSPILPEDCNVRLPLRDLEGNARRDLTTDELLMGPYVSSGLVPHLAACSFHVREIQTLGGTQVFLAEEFLTNIDTGVQRDYMELLFPLALDYTQKFIEAYFAPRLEVIPIGEGQFGIHNLSPWPFEFSADAIQVFYDDEEGERAEADIDCGGAGAEVTLGPTGSETALGTVSCSLTGPLHGGVPKNRGEFVVVVRGKLGERGEVGAASEFDSGARDFVVGFDHIRSTILFDRIVGDSSSDATEVDIWALEIDPTTEVGEKPRRARNLTDAFRDSFGDPTLDVLAPVALPGKPLVAVRSDLAGSGQGGYVDVQGELDVYLWAPHAAATGEAPLRSVPGSRIGGIVARPMLLSSWTPDGQTLFYIDNAADADEASPYQSLNRYAVDSGVLEKFVVDAAFNSSHEKDVDIQTLAVGEEIVVCKGVEQVSAVSADSVFVTTRCRKERVVDPDGDGENSRELVEEKAVLHRMQVTASAEEPGKLDGERTHRLSAGGSNSCSDDCWNYQSAAYSPVVSPDGQQVAFLSEPPQNDADPPRDRPEMDVGERLHVVSVSGLGMRTVVDEDAPRIMTPSWSPDGVWLSFGIAQGDPDQLFSTLGPRDLYAVRSDAFGAEPTRLTRDGEFARLHSWYKPGLELPEN